MRSRFQHARTGNRVSRPVEAVARALLRAAGWSLRGSAPPLGKYLLIAAPHTSDADFFVMLPAAWAWGVRVHWLGKQELFRGALGPVMRAIGGIPVTRGARGDLVQQAADAFQREAQLVVAVLPKGTRGARPTWRSGFYAIARSAHVPLVMVSADYATRTLRISEPLTLTGDVQRDMNAVRAFYAGVQGRRSDRNDVIRLEEETRGVAVTGSR